MWIGQANSKLVCNPTVFLTDFAETAQRIERKYSRNKYNINKKE